MNNNQEGFGQNIKTTGFFNNRLLLMLVISFLVIIIIAMVGLLIYLKKSAPKDTMPKDISVKEEQDKDGHLNIGKLPEDEQNNNNQNDINSASSTLNQVENLLFGNFYHKYGEALVSVALNYELPLNVKSQASNYYDLARKIEISDENIEKLNQNGFVVLDNQFKANNLNDLYRYFLDNNIPIIITSDYLIYYYQNVLKQSFKEIEKNIFYEKLWNISRELFDIANKRYQKRKLDSGLTNDPVLEAERMEAAYFAVTLKLLEPTSKQINVSTKFIDENKFTSQEAEKFYFEVPSYLKVDVNKELSLIREAQKTAKSPIFFYEIDYSSFEPPRQYQGNAKLNNFYLASHWLNLVFPLYFRTQECLDCLLDENDWRITTIAASLISYDIFQSDDLKKEWASIYKIIAFFRGLRQDLTYLHYNQSLQELFGDNYDIETLFSKDNPDSFDNLLKLQNKLTSFYFSELEGGLSRDDSQEIKKIGLKILQDSYWPDKYILNHFIYPYVGKYKEEIEGKLPITACPKKKENAHIRCRALGLDIINLIYPINNDYFLKNINYEGYKDQVALFRETLDKFNVYSWHNNNFWTTLYLLKEFLSPANTPSFIYTQTEDWQAKKINTALGAWLNLQLPLDKFVFTDASTVRHSFYLDEEKYDYIEANSSLIQELLANTKMLLDMLNALGINEYDNTASLYLKDLLLRLEKIETIINKELRGDTIEQSEYKFIADFIKQFTIKGLANKKITIQFKNKRDISESLEGVKIILLATKQKEKIILNAGALFNYQEKR